MVKKKYKFKRKRSPRAMTPHSNPVWGVITPTALSKVGKYALSVCETKIAKNDDSTREHDGVRLNFDPIEFRPMGS